ncbi:phage tail protein, partial [Staphylococcus epidermidis]|nr:phage tail protein [Staphylococcus epidermidis]
MNKWGIPDKNPFNTSHKERRYTFYDTKVGDVYYGGPAEINQFNQDSVVEMTLGENVSKNDSDGFNFYMT